MGIFLNAFLRSIIESITEFLPVSSTGHLFLFSSNFPFTGIENANEFDDLFDIFIQSGAILAVLVLYFSFLKEKFLLSVNYLKKQTEDFSGIQFFISILIGTIPILVFGFIFKKKLDIIKSSENLLLVLGLAWLIGGVLILTIEKFFSTETKTQLTFKDSILIGIFQCVALIPGVSRSGATIMTSKILGLKKDISAEYSFFLAIPVLISASAYKLFKYRTILNSENLIILTFGFVLSFIFSILVIRLFIRFIKKYSFISFGYYRIFLGIIVLIIYFR